MKYPKPVKLKYCIAALLALGGCQKGPKPSLSAPKQNPSPIDAPSSSPSRPEVNQVPSPLPTPQTVPPLTEIPRRPLPQLQVKAMGQNQANVYFVELKWSEALDASLSWLLQRKDAAGNTAILNAPDEKQTQFVDTTAQAGSKYQYTLGYLQGSRFNEVSKQALQVPLDLLLNNEQRLVQIKNYARVFMTESALLRTDGNRLEIHTDELISNYGSIQTWPEGTKAPIGNDGKNAEVISIHAKKARGVLRINGSGMTGGDGLRGADGALGAQGSQGPHCSYSKKGPANVVSDQLEYTLCDQPLAPEWAIFWECTATGNGRDGGIGYPGAQGLKGGKGGNSARLFVQIEEASPAFDLRLSANPGQGGIPGDGGDGGLGGLGGAPGSWDPHHLCAEPQPGSQGPRGPKGPTGIRGDNGQAGATCIKINDKIDGDCNGFIEKDGFIY